MNTPHLPLTRFALSLLLTAMAPPVLLAAMPADDAEIAVNSTPPGATVRVMGKSWGTTPMRLRLKEAFPALYRPEQPFVGLALYLRRAGCEEHRQPLHRRNIPAEINVALECSHEPAAAIRATAVTAPREMPAGTPAAPATPAAADPSSAMPPPATATAAPEKSASPPSTVQFSTVRKKLEELEQLKRDGLISEQEYQSLRRRILSYF